MLLAVGPGPAVLLAALVIVALHTEVVRGVLLPLLLGAHPMHPLFVFELTSVKFSTY